MITNKSYWFSLRMTLWRFENWGTYLQNKIWTLLCRQSFSSRGTQSYKIESSSFTHIATGIREGMEETQEDEANYSPRREAGVSPGFLQGGLSGYDSLESKEEMLRRWGERKNMANTAETRIQSLNYRPVTASLETGIQWLRVAYATMLEEWQWNK